MKDYYPYFEQEDPQATVTGMIAEFDQSEPYELDAAAVFAVDAGRYLVVIVSSCSCWPDYGVTTQHVCVGKADVDRVLSDPVGWPSGLDRSWRELLQRCQDAGWRVAQPRATPATGEGA